MNDNDNDKIDITGLMEKPVENWQERVERLAKAENFKVRIETVGICFDDLTEHERIRLEIKLKLVALWARNMCAGMCKGTLKYATDDYELDQWFAHMVGEGVDQSNYQILLFDAYQRSKGEQK